MQLPLNVSPVSASFIGLMRLGILLVLSLACTACSFPREGERAITGEGFTRTKRPSSGLYSLLSAQ